MATKRTSLAAIDRKLRDMWPHLDNVERKTIDVIVSAMTDPEHPLHKDVIAILGDAGTTRRQKMGELDDLLHTILHGH